MKINFFISKHANQFFFISNLSEWNPSCRKEYNRNWLKMTGKLSFKERRILKKSGGIIRKYSNRNLKFKPNYLDVVFHSPLKEKQVWSQAIRLLSAKEIKLLKDTFKVLNPCFKKIWLKAKSRLTKNKRFIEKQILKTPLDIIIRSLSRFYKNPFPRNKLNISLIYAPIKKGGGGKSLSSNLIIIERGLIKNSSQAKKTLVILIHEMIHSLFEGSYFLKQIDLFVKKIPYGEKVGIENMGWRLENLLKEAVAHTITPEGYLAEKYFSLPVKKPERKHPNSKKLIRVAHQKLLYSWIAYRMYQTTQDYLNNKKTIDQRYLQVVYQLIKRNL